jgi:hypothetical protein
MPEIDLGHELEPFQHPGLRLEQIAAYMQAAQLFAEGVFADSAVTRSLGYWGTLVPGTLLTALVERYLSRELPGWDLERMSATFRVPTFADDGLLIRGVVTERHETPDGVRIVCDVVVGHSDADDALTATATLRSTV